MTKPHSNIQTLRRTAARVTRDIVRRLPAKLRAALAAVAVVLQDRPDRRQLDAGIAGDWLGVFEGPSLRDSEDPTPLPPQITLFLENIEAEARASGQTYAAEVRRTFLHELGHYLGLDEDDLALRDMD